MDTGLIFMIVGTALFASAGILTAVYGYKLSKQFPKIIKAKVTRIETLENGRFKYHFEGIAAALS